MGLTLVIDANLDDFSVTNGKFDGFKVTEKIEPKRTDCVHISIINLGASSFTGRISRRL